jgi:hypothetical protein
MGIECTLSILVVNCVLIIFKFEVGVSKNMLLCFLHVDSSLSLFFQRLVPASLFFFFVFQHFCKHCRTSQINDMQKKMITFFCVACDLQQCGLNLCTTFISMNFCSFSSLLTRRVCHHFFFPFFSFYSCVTHTVAVLELLHHGIDIARNRTFFLNHNYFHNGYSITITTVPLLVFMLYRSKLSACSIWQRQCFLLLDGQLSSSMQYPILSMSKICSLWTSHCSVFDTSKWSIQLPM